MRMKYSSLLTAVVIALLVCVLPSSASAEESADGFVPIFNGKDLTGWYGLGHFDPRKVDAMNPEQRQELRKKNSEPFKTHWSVEDGELVNDGKGPFATSEKSYRDIELYVDYRTVAKADSGIYLKQSPQVQIWDYTKEGGKWKLGADKGSGGLWNQSKGAAGKDPLVFADKPFGEWNRFFIRQIGSRTSVTLNDKLVVDHVIMENFWDRKKPLRPEGPIQLQTHGGEIRWKNIKLRELSAEQSNAILDKHNDEGFEPVFNGRDFTGWAGALDNYEIVDGAIACRKGKGGNLYTEAVYGDFVVRLEFLLPPGGNNGLAIRYPGKGSPAFAGMCELQVLDNSAEKYAKLKERQYHGSAYGMVAAHRGFLRPVGQWNFQEVTVKGSTVRVELNGSVILDADLSKVTDFMDGKAHPGKDLREGHFGFAGHNDPVRFRNIRIRRL